MKSASLGTLLGSLSGLLNHAAAGDFEWAGIFETPADDYLWTAQKVDGAYVDPGMKLVALPATSFTDQALHDLEAAGGQAMDLNCTAVQAGGTIVPAANVCYQLEFQATAWQSLFNVDASGVAGIAFFAEHVPTEFEATAHYLKDSAGEDIEPNAELPDAHGDHAEAEADVDAGGPVLAAVLVNLATFIGVILMLPPLRRLVAERPVFHALLFSFAAGALLACAFFLLLFEATHLIAVGWTAEVDVLWRWGTMILAGMVVPPVVDSIFSLFIMFARDPTAHQKAEAEKEEEEEKEKEDDQAVKMAKRRARARLLGAVLIGDFFHNLCDGFFLGAAFKGCGSGFGWGVAAATILHELPQEVADFIVLTSPEVGLGPLKALGANFLSGLSVLIGTLIVLYAQVDDQVVGLILAFGGGVYLHLAAVDCMPKMYDPRLSFGGRLSAFAVFGLGAVLIGLILLGHEHCVTEEGGQEEGGNSHAHAHGH